MASVPSKGGVSGPFKASIKIETITPSIDLGEGPFWDHEKGLLYFVNLYASEVHSYEAATEKHTFIKIGDKPVTFVIPLADKKNQFLISLGRELHILEWDGKSPQFLVEPHIIAETREDSRMNDAKASPSNVLFAGSMGNEKGTTIPDKQGSLYVVRNKSTKTLLDRVGIANGLAWTADEKIFFWNDTMAMKTYKFKYNRLTHEITDQTVLVDFKAKNVGGQPDGLTIDSEGYLWIACIKGSKIIKVDPKTGEILFSVGLPCTDVTSVEFGGPNFDVIYCTTATHNVDKKDLTLQAGCVLKITGLPSRGVPSHRVKL